MLSSLPGFFRGGGFRPGLRGGFLRPAFTGRGAQGAVAVASAFHQLPLPGLDAHRVHHRDQQREHQEGSRRLDEDGDATACAIFNVSETNHITLSQFFTAHKKPSASIAVLQACAKSLLEQFPPEATLEIPTLTNSSSKLVQRLLPDSQAVCLSRAVLDLTKE